MKEKKYDIGVIVGRFQVPTLDTEEQNIFDYCIAQNFKTNIVFIGLPPDSIKATKNNPLDFDARRKMIDDAYNDMFKIYYIKDEKYDGVWSKKLDELIKGFKGTPLILGTTECCKKYYGEFDFKVFESKRRVNSESYLRELAGKKVLSNEAWRAGAIWATQNRYDTAYPTVDCLIIDGPEVWMGRKGYESKLRFIGGFVDVSRDRGFEDSAVREAKEETGLDCEVIGYVCSKMIDDWRYANETDKIITTMYALNRVGGTPKAGDDIAEIRRVNLMDLTDEDVVYEHVPLLHEAKRWHKEAMQDLIEAED